MKKNSLFYKIKVSWWFFFGFVKKIEFIDAKAIADNDQQLLCDSEDEEREKITEELDDFIDNNSQLGESVNVYRDVNNNPSEFHS